MDWSVPKVVVALTAVFLVVNLAGVLNLRGVADPEGFVLNTSRMIPVNTHEDDGHLNITAMLGHLPLHQTKFSYYFNIGGPFLLLVQGAAAIGDSLGLVRRFDDPTLYWFYPEELTRAWRFFGLVKLAFLAWLPVTVFWFGANHISRRTGIIAALLVTAMPFIPGFEQRMKVDSVVIATGLLSMLFQVAYARWGRERDLFTATAILAVSLAMKFVMLPAAAILAGCFILGERIRRERLLNRQTAFRAAKTCALGVAVFFLANPRFIPGIVFIALDYSRTISASHTAAPSSGFAATMLYRLTALGPIMGSWANALALPILLAALAACSLPARFGTRAGVTAVLAFFVLDILYLYCFVGSEGMRSITYYFFAASVALCLLTGFVLDRLAQTVSRLFPLAGYIALAGGLALAAVSFMEQITVLDYVLGPSNRQQALAWIDEHATPGACVGVPMPENGVPLNSLYWVDPYRHPTVVLGTKLEFLADKRPNYVVRILDAAAKHGPIPAGYEVAADFERGAGLSGGDARDMFQDEAYQILRRTGDSRKSDSATLESRLYHAMRRDPEPVFNIMTFHASTFFPISLEMLRKDDSSLTPFPIVAFTVSIREGSRLDYIHQIPPACLTLWGVKYVLAKAEEGGAVRAQVLSSGRYPLEPASGWAHDGDQPALFDNIAYKGQVLFIPDAPPLASLKADQSNIYRSKGRLPLYGDIPTYQAPQGGLEALEVSIALETDRPMDCILSGGSKPQSVVLGPGYHETRVPYQVDGGALRYEVNPVTPPARAILHSLEVRPLRLEGSPTITSARAASRQAQATLDASAPGRVVFALPWHRYWRAEVDGVAVDPQRGPGNTVAVAVPAGRHLASLSFGR